MRKLFLLSLLLPLLALQGCQTLSKVTGGDHPTTAQLSDLENESYRVSMVALSFATSAADSVHKGNWLWYGYGLLQQVAGNPNASAPMLEDAIGKFAPNDGQVWSNLASQLIQFGLSQFHGAIPDKARAIAHGIGRAASTVVPAST